MTKNSLPPSLFCINRSRWLLLTLHSLHLLALLACWLNSLPIPLKLLGNILCLISWKIQQRKYQTEPIYLRYSATDNWAISFDGSSFSPIKLKADTVISSLLIVLRFEISNQLVSLPICKDALPAGDYRKLIVLLKITGPTFN
jgi:hypothetical protein